MLRASSYLHLLRLAELISPLAAASIHMIVKLAGSQGRNFRQILSIVVLYGLAWWKQENSKTAFAVAVIPQDLIQCRFFGTQRFVNGFDILA